MPNHHTLYGKTQNKIQNLLSHVVLFRNVPWSPALFAPWPCVEAPGGTCSRGRSATSRVSQQGQKGGGRSTALCLREQLCVHAVIQAGDNLLLASLKCHEASTNTSVLLLQVLQACTATDSPSQAGGVRREGICLAKGHKSVVGPDGKSVAWTP